MSRGLHIEFLGFVEKLGQCPPHLFVPSPEVREILSSDGFECLFLKESTVLAGSGRTAWLYNVSHRGYQRNWTLYVFTTYPIPIPEAFRATVVSGYRNLPETIYSKEIELDQLDHAP